jgi:hypothetical protein
MIKIKLKNGKKISMSEETALDLYQKLAHHLNNYYGPCYTVHTVPIVMKHGCYDGLME